MVDLAFKFFFEDQLREEASDFNDWDVHLASQKCQLDSLVRLANSQDSVQSDRSKKLIKVLSNERVRQKVQFLVVDDFLDRLDVVIVEASLQVGHANDLWIGCEDLGLLGAQHIKLCLGQE